MYNEKLKVFCDERNYNKWPFAEVKRQVYDEEYRQLSLFEEEALLAPTQIRLCEQFNEFNKILVYKI